MKSLNFSIPRFDSRLARGTWILFMFFGSALPSNAMLLAQSDSQQDAIELKCRGTVVNEHEERVANARVFLVGPHDLWASISKDPWTTQFFETTTDGKGNFSFDLSPEDPRLLRIGLMRIFVVKPGLKIAAERFSLTRLTVDLPFDFQLSKAKPVTVRVVNAKGQPVVGASVAVANCHSIVLPVKVSSETASISDASGTVTLDTAADANPFIHVVSEFEGNHCVQTFISDGELHAKLKPTFDADVQLEFPKTATKEEIASVSFRNVSFDDTKMDQVFEYSWCQATSDSEGHIRVKNAIAGMSLVRFAYPANYPYRAHSRTGAYLQLDPAKLTYNISLHPAVTLTGLVKSSNEGTPLKNMAVSTWFTSTFSNEAGEFEIRVAQGDTIDFQVDAPFGNWAKPTIMYKRVTAPKNMLEKELTPVELLPSKIVIGLVRDADGNAVSGANIQCEKSTQFGPVKTDFRSDTNGNFKLFGFVSGDSLKITGSNKNTATSKPSFVTIDSEKDSIVSSIVKLTLVPQIRIALKGRVVDTNGQLIPNATVEIQRLITLVEESNNTILQRSEPFVPAQNTVAADKKGSFVSLPTKDWDAAISVTVRHDDYILSVSPQIPTGIYKPVDGVIDLGNFVIRKRPERVASVVRVVDQAGNPVGNATVVFVEPRFGVSKVTTGRDGIAKFNGLQDSKQIMAVQADGYRHIFKSIEHPQSLMTLTMAAASLPSNPGGGNSQWTTEEMQGFAKTLRNRFVAISLKDSTPIRIQLKLAIEAVADPENFRRLIQSKSEIAGGMESVIVGLYMLFDRQLGVPANQPIMKLLRSRLANLKKVDSSKAWALIDIAVAEEESESRIEVLSDAHLIARRLSGDERTRVLGEIARKLWMYGHRNEARAVAREAWQLDPTLHAKVRNPKVNRAGIARLFGPIFAVVDPDASMQLIEVTGYPNEIDALKTAALLYVCESDLQKFLQMTKDLRVRKIDAGQFAGFNMPACDDQVALDAAKNFLPNGHDKRLWMIEVASRLSESNNNRPFLRRWIDSILNDFQNSDPDVRLQSCRDLCQLLPAARIAGQQWENRVLFEALKAYEKAAVRFGRPNFEALALELAKSHPELSRTLIEPMWQETSWLHEAQVKGTCTAEILRAAVRIDPNFALKILNRLCDETFKHDQTTQLFVTSTVVSEIQTMIFERGAENSK